jgi:hypothetical protein
MKDFMTAHLLYRTSVVAKQPIVIYQSIAASCLVDCGRFF